MIFLNLMHNITLLVSLGILYGVIIRRWKPETAHYRILSGLLFGGVALMGMLTPVKVAPGIITDGRSIILALAGLFGGGTVALIAALMSATYRIWLGGAGMYVGLSLITESALLGVVYGRLRRKYAIAMRPLYILYFSILVHLIMLALPVIIQPEYITAESLQWILPQVLIIYPLVTLFLSLLFLDQEAHVRTQLELAESERKYRLLVENANSIILRWTPDGFVRFINDYGLRFFGYSREEIIGQHVLGTFVPDTESTGRDLTQMINEIIQNPERFASNENENICKDGRRVWVHWSNRAVRDENGKIQELFTVGTDITASRMMEQADKKNSEFIQLLLENMPYPVYYKDMDGKYIGCNRSFQKILGVKSEEMIGHTVFDIAPPDLAVICDKADRELFAHPGVQVYESEMRGRDGSWHTVVFHKATFNRLDGSVGGIVGAILDITERKQAEETLRESERKYRHLFEYMITGFALHEVILDENGEPADYRFLEVNPAYEKLTGLRAEHIQGRTVLEILPNIEKMWIERYGRVALTGEPVSFEDYSAELGRYYDVLAYSPQKGQFAVIFNDITRRKQAEEELIRSEKQIRSILRVQPVGVGLVLNRVFKEVNEQYCEIVGYEREEILGRSTEFLYLSPEEYEAVGEMYKRIVEQGGGAIEARHRRKDGRIIDVMLSFAPLDAGDLSRGFTFAAMDITERKRMEAELRRNEEQLRSILRVQPVGVGLVADRILKEVNDQFCELLGYPREEILGHNSRFLFVTSEEYEAVGELYKQVAEQGSGNIETRYRRKDGRPINVMICLAPLDPLDLSKGCVFAVLDITESKHMEAELRRNEEQLRSILQVQPVGVGMIQDRVFKEVNEHFCTMLGYTRDEIQGRKSDFIYPSREEAEFVGQQYARVAEQGLATAEVRFRRKDGQVIDVLANLVPMDRNDLSKGVTFCVVEITERKRMESELRRSEEQFRSILRVQPVGVGMVANRVFKEVNDQFCELLGYSREEMLEKPTNFIYPSVEEYEHVGRHYKDVAERGSVTIETHWRRKDGRVLDIILSLAAFDRTDLSKGVIFADMDITERKRMEAELKRNEEQLRNILRVQPVGVGLSIGRVLTEINEQFCEMMGYSREEAIGCNTELFYASREDYELVGKHLPLVAEQGACTVETRFRRKDGQVIDALMNLAPMDRTDLSKGLSFTVLDITERKRLELELIQNEKKISSILRVAPVGIGLLVRRVFKEVNPRMCEMVGYERQELIDQSARIIYSTNEEYDWVGLEKYRQIAEKGSGTVETRWLRKDGQIIDVLLSSTPLDPQNLDRGVTFTALDITERKRAEERLRFLASTVEQAIESVIIRDTEGVIRYVNPAFEASSGYSAAEVVGRMMYFMDFGPESQALLEEILDTLKSGKVWSGRVQSLRKDGTAYTEEASATPIRDEQGKIVSYLTLKKDVTRELELEEQLRQSQKMEAVGLLAGGVAHDLNNMLTPILGYAELLMYDEKVPDSSKQNIQEIVSAGGKARDLVGQLMAFGRKQTLQVRSLNLNEVIPGTSRLLHRTLRENIRIELRLGASVRSVRADRGQVEQVLMNLAVNAQDAMPDGGMLIIETQDVELDRDYTVHHSQVTPGHYVMMSVIDTGMGMDPEVRSRIFEPFFTTKGVGKGTGLGLATVYGIVKQHGGYIWVYSEPGQGTTFKVYLPAIEQEAVESTENHSSKETPVGTETLLIAEDDPTVRELACSMLASLGYNILSGSTVKECLELVADLSTQIDLLLTDVIMPEMSGKDLIIQLRQSRPELKALYMSGYAADLISDHGVLEEGVSFIQKPFTRQALAGKVRECLDS